MILTDEQIEEIRAVPLLTDIPNLLETIAALKTENNALRDVAEFYGEEENWDERIEDLNHIKQFVSNAKIDNGQRAREALGT